MSAEQSKYQALGVDASKQRVREIFGRIVHNDFPGAFVNIVRDPERLGTVFTKHSDGDGSKMVQRLLHFLEIGDPRIFQGAVDDAFSMNKGDVAASGFVFGRWVLTQILNINGANAPKELIMAQIAERVESLLALYRSYGFSTTYFLGGETADLPDQIQSAVYDVDVFAEAEEADLIKGNVQPGDQIYGFASDGQAIWEDCPNSGLMSNGLTLGRTYLMLERYGTERSFLIRGGGSYKGNFAVTDRPEILEGMTVSEALLSPTRQWAILIRLLIEELKKRGIFNLLHAISMNTGGGATKVTHVGQGILYRKEMPEPPPIFRLIQAESGEKWRDMYRGLNCGIGIDVVGEKSPRFTAALEQVSQATGVKLFHLGDCVENEDDGNRVILKTQYGTFNDY